jgi:3-oxoacyl-[acyl-carrier-protein] synthase II
MQRSEMRRVVVTGMGIASPLGIGVEHVWKRLIAGDSGITSIQSFDTKDLACTIAGQVPQGARAEGKLDLAEWIPVKDQKKMDRFIHLAMVAAAEAVEDSGWVPETEAWGPCTPPPTLRCRCILARRGGCRRSSSRRR